MSRGGEACQHNSHTSSTVDLQSIHLSQSQWKCEILLILFFQVSEAHFVTPPFVEIQQQEIFEVLSSEGVRDVEDLPVFLVISFPFVATCVAHLVAFGILSAGIEQECWPIVLPC